MEESNSRKVRSACDICHALKMKCSGGDPCTGCARSKQPCIYSEPNRLGRPKGSKNKKAQQPCPPSKRPHNKAGVKGRNPSPDSDSSPRPSPAEQGRALGLDELLSAGDVDGLQDFLEPNAFVDVDDDTIFPSAPISEGSWEHAPEFLHGLDAGMGLKTQGPSSSMLPLGEGDDFRRVMQAVDLSLSSGIPHMSQDPPSSGLPRTRSVPGEMDMTDHCACIGNQARFISSLKKMEGKYSPAPVPVILQATQDSRILWERLMHCSACRRDRDSVAVLMFGMGLRYILRGLQCLILNQQASQHSMHSAGYGPGAFSNGTAPLMNGAHHRDFTFENINLGSIKPRSGSFVADRIRVGSFEVPQEEQAFLTDVLIARALSKLKSILESVAGYLERVSDVSLQSIEHSEKWPVHFVLEDLQRSVLKTEGSMREIIQR